MLIARGAEVDIFVASAIGDFDKAERLLKENPKLVKAKDGYRTTPLHRAARHGHKQIAELLLAHGADVNATGTYDSTPLHRAAETGRTQVAGVLVAHGARVNAVGRYGFTPLHFAADRGHADLVKLLLTLGTDINAGDEKTGRHCSWP
jgi:ankyrin repeat protein